MSMLKITILLQVFITNKMLIINKVNSIEDNNKLIRKYIKLEIEKLSK